MAIEQPVLQRFLALLPHAALKLLVQCGVVVKASKNKAGNLSNVEIHVFMDGDLLRLVFEPAQTAQQRDKQLPRTRQPATAVAVWTPEKEFVGFVVGLPMRELAEELKASALWLSSAA